MSEEILRALMQLFAIIAKQDEGAESSEVEYVKTFLTLQLNDDKVKEYFELFERHAGLDDASEERALEGQKKQKLTSVKDSVRILALCKKINKTLTQNQKIVVLVRLFEMINTDRKFSEQRMAIINTVAEVFNISKEEFKSIQSFVVNDDLENFDDPSILLINDKQGSFRNCKH